MKLLRRRRRQLPPEPQVNLDLCLDQFTDHLTGVRTGQTLVLWCQLPRGHSGSHRGLDHVTDEPATTIVEWDGLGYFIRRAPAPEKGELWSP